MINETLIIKKFNELPDNFTGIAVDEHAGETYYKNGEKHNENGASYICGKKCCNNYYLNGISYGRNKEKYEEALKELKLQREKENPMEIETKKKIEDLLSKLPIILLTEGKKVEDIRIPFYSYILVDDTIQHDKAKLYLNKELICSARLIANDFMIDVVNDKKHIELLEEEVNKIFRIQKLEEELKKYPTINANLITIIPTNFTGTVIEENITKLFVNGELLVSFNNLKKTLYDYSHNKTIEDILNKFEEKLFSLQKPKTEQIIDKETGLPIIIVNDKKHKFHIDEDYIQKDYTGILKYSNGTTKYFLNGKLHNENGPAIIWDTGEENYWLNGIRYVKETWEIKIKQIKIENICSKFRELPCLNGNRKFDLNNNFNGVLQSGYGFITVLNGEMKIEYNFPSLEELKKYLLDKSSLDEVKTIETEVNQILEAFNKSMNQQSSKFQTNNIQENGEVKNMSNNETKSSSKTSAIIQTAKSDLSKTGYRITANKISKMISTFLAETIANRSGMKGASKKNFISTMENFFASPYGNAMISVVIGSLLPLAKNNIPGISQDKIEALSEEFRVRGLTTVGDELLDVITGPLAQGLLMGITSAMQSMEEPASLVRVETDSTEAKAHNTNNHHQEEGIERTTSLNGAAKTSSFAS